MGLQIVSNLIHKGQQSQPRAILSIDVLQYTWINIGNNVNTASPSTIYNYITRIYHQNIINVGRLLLNQ